MTLQNGKAHNHANYFDINNSSYFYPNWGQITVNYGLSYQNNNYKRQATITDNDAYDSTPFSPSGNQNIWGIYANNSIQKDIYTANISLSRVHTKFSGFKPACGEVEGIVIPCFPQGASSIEKSDLAWNGKMQLSAKVNDWFNPFVSYVRTSRMPNIQEVFFNNQGGGSMNPFLKAENADIKEIGFNSFKQGVFGSNDRFGLKAVYFHHKINNYIHSQSFFLQNDGKLTDDINNVSPASFNAYISVNSLKPVISKGMEIQTYYDAQKYFANLSYTQSKSNQPININSGFHAFGFGGGAIDRLPEKYWTLDLGSRLLDNKLQLGTSLRYYGKNTRLRPDGIDVDTSNYHLQAMPKTPIITDLHLSYQMNSKAQLQLGIENLFDKTYIHPLHAQNATSDQLADDGESYQFTNYARGRTINIGAQFRF